MSVTFNKMCNDLDPSCNESAPNKTSYHNLDYDVHVFIYICLIFLKIISIFVQFFFSNNKPLFGKEILQMF